MGFKGYRHGTIEYHTFQALLFTDNESDESENILEGAEKAMYRAIEDQAENFGNLRIWTVGRELFTPIGKHETAPLFVNEEIAVLVDDEQIDIIDIRHRRTASSVYHAVLESIRANIEGFLY